ncbi:MAG: hypothetical protein KC444_05070 [Nitrosopumilus sp.]|nr:hypothetical protein [Nitrosopumilus sp.]
MNIYDTKTVSCIACGKCIGEVDYDAEVIYPKCGKCAHPLPEGDSALYTVSYFQNNPPKKKKQIESA